MTNHSIFITGTDTGIGKTTITGALLLALQQQGKSVGILKPVETGVDPENRKDSDTDRLRHLLSPPPSFDSTCLYAFPHPLAPLAASRHTGKTIDLSKICTHTHRLTHQYPFLLIEGAGGIFTPLAPQLTLRDLVALLRVPCIIVGSTNLGGVNHCLLTIHALQQVGIPICSIVLNTPNFQNMTEACRQQQESTVELIREWSTAPVFGPIEFTPLLETNWLEGLKQLAEHTKIQQLATHLLEKA